MKQPISCRVEAFWDSEAEVWVATSEDVPGLATEADTIETLTQKLRQMIPELMLLNDIVSPNYAGELEFQLTTHRQEKITVPS